MKMQFNIAEKGVGSYRSLAILRWVMVLTFVAFGIQKFTNVKTMTQRRMVLTFVAFGIQKFTPQSAHGIVLYISNSPFVDIIILCPILQQFLSNAAPRRNALP